jgi:hypothetical protein
MSNAYHPQQYAPPVPYQPWPAPHPLPPYQPPSKRSPSKIMLTCLVTSLLALCTLVTLSGSLFLVFFLHNGPAYIAPPRPTLPPLTVYSVVGQPTIDVQFINSVLNYYHSPASGKGQALYDDGVKYDINPAYALAFFLEESTFGTKGIATVTHALGNIRADAGEPQYDGYRLYDTWEEGFADWYQLIANKYVGAWHLSTVDQIIPVYAPSEDNNNEVQYIHTIKWAIERWRNGYAGV